MSEKSKEILIEIYRRLFKHFGPQHWWPGESPFEVMVGAILTQNTNWKNVEKAIQNLKSKNYLVPRMMRELPPEILAELIRPAGYFNVKTKRLKAFLEFFHEVYGDSIEKMRAQETQKLRRELLGIKGIGPETADSILLYALQHPLFVIDAYTYRVLSRHFLIPEESNYEEMQELMMRYLPAEEPYYNEYHALIVSVGKDFCGPTPKCDACPLKGLNW